MKTLLTGATGFLGQHLISFLKTHYPSHALHVLGRKAPGTPGVTFHPADLTRATETEEAVTAIKPDWVFHLAGHSRVRDNAGVPEYFADNFLSTAHLLKGLERAGGPVRIFFASSVHIYGHQTDTVDESSPAHPFSPYGFTKYLAEEALRAFCQKHSDTRVVVGRLYNCIGPHQPLGFVASDWCRQLSEVKSGTSDGTRGAMKVGPLSGLRYFLDVRDTVGTFPQLLEKADPGLSVFNIASDAPTTLGELLNELLRISGKSPRIEESKDEGRNRFTGLKVDSQKLRRALPQLRFRPLTETLKDMYAACANP